jgi:hypothetical protein
MDSWQDSYYDIQFILDRNSIVMHPHYSYESLTTKKYVKSTSANTALLVSLRWHLSNVTFSVLLHQANVCA